MDIRNEPIRKFVTFNHAQKLLGHEWRGSTENALKKGYIRFVPVSADSEKGMARLLYKPDVVNYAKRIKKSKASNE